MGETEIPEVNSANHKTNVNSTGKAQRDDRAASSGKHERRTTGLSEFLFYFLIALLFVLLGVILNAALREAWQWMIDSHAN